jgi:hypothetical protein
VGNDFAMDEKLVNEMLGLPRENLDEVVTRVLRWILRVTVSTKAEAAGLAKRVVLSSRFADLHEIKMGDQLHWISPRS